MSALMRAGAAASVPAVGGGGGLSYVDTILADGPIRYYRFEEASGNLIDVIGGNNLATTGTITREAPGAVDDAYIFGGGHAFASVGPATVGPKTYEFWTKLLTSDTSANSYVIGRQNSFDVVFHFGGANTFGMFRNSAVPTIATTHIVLPVPRDDLWHHVVFAYDGAEILGYVDGVEVDDLPITGDITPGTAFRVCSAADTPSAVFRGGMDELAVYDYGLSPGQVVAHYDAWVAGL